MVMLGWTDLKDEIAVSWKVSWNVDPLPLSVPDSLVDEDPPPLLDGVLVVVDELQAAARTAVAARATPTVVARLMRRSCMSYTPFPVGEN
jgi:hypothetical protein